MMRKRKQRVADTVESRPESGARRWTRRIALSLSAMLCLGLAFCYVVRPDACAAVTIFPAWIWPAPGLLLTAPGWNRAGRRAAGAVALLWVVFLGTFAEEARSLMRFDRGTDPVWAAARRQGRAFRIVSLNCAGGDPKAAAEVAYFRPDIVLLQESPDRAAVESLARRLWSRKGGVLWGVDASILARGSVQPAPLSLAQRAWFVQARVQLTEGPPLEIVSLRLLPPLFREDLWSPECWREHARNRRDRRRQLRPLTARLRSVPVEAPLIVGGDFNAPAGDAVYRLLSPRLQDTFRQAGRGWGNTAINEFPFARIDQVWVSRPLYATRVRASRTVHSDHRMVVCDLVLR